MIEEGALAGIPEGAAMFGASFSGVLMSNGERKEPLTLTPVQAMLPNVQLIERLVSWYALHPDGTTKQAADDLKVSIALVRAIRGSDFFQDKLAKATKDINSTSIGLREVRIRALVEKALDGLDNAMDSDNERIALTAGRTALEVGGVIGGKAGITVNVQNVQHVGMEALQRAREAYRRQVGLDGAVEPIAPTASEATVEVKSEA